MAHRRLVVTATLCLALLVPVTAFRALDFRADAKKDRIEFWKHRYLERKREAHQLANRAGYWLHQMRIRNRGTPTFRTRPYIRARIKVRVVRLHLVRRQRDHALTLWRRLRLIKQGGGTPASNRALGQQLAAQAGWTGQQWHCLDVLWGQRESGWSHHATNPSGAGGIPQALPATKMGPKGIYESPATQIRWGLQYVRSSYGSPCAALSHSYSYGWY